MREGIEGYRFDVPSGKYELELLFTDTRQQQALSVYLLGRDQAQQSSKGNPEGFGIEVNGKCMDSNFVPGVEAGYFTAIRRSYVVDCGNDGLEVKFPSKQNKAFLSGIKLRRLF